MIIQSAVELEIGKIYHDEWLTDKDGKYISGLSYQILAESNVEEYLIFCRDNGSTIEPILNSDFRYYRISID